jgi:hypothetical protein
VWINITHESIPHLDCALALENVDPNRTPEVLFYESRGDEAVIINGLFLLCKGICVIAEEVIEGIWVSLDVELHLPFFDDLPKLRFGETRRER